MVVTMEKVKLVKVQTDRKKICRHFFFFFFFWPLPKKFLFLIQEYNSKNIFFYQYKKCRKILKTYSVKVRKHAMHHSCSWQNTFVVVAECNGIAFLKLRKMNLRRACTKNTFFHNYFFFAHFDDDKHFANC
jgi:hypothetical protein